MTKFFNFSKPGCGMTKALVEMADKAQAEGQQLIYIDPKADALKKEQGHEWIEMGLGHMGTRQEATEEEKAEFLAKERDAAS